MKPLLLTCGEPAGVAPEITLAAWQALHHDPQFAFALIGDADYQTRRRRPPWQDVPVCRIRSLAEAQQAFLQGLPVLHRPLPAMPDPGIFEAKTAPAVIAAIDEAVQLTIAGQASAIVTNPIQKEALYQVGFRHQGHTDYLASLAAVPGQPAPQEVMMLVAEGLRAVPVTVHIPLAEVPRLLTTDLICAQARVVDRDLRNRFGIPAPRLTLTGLNPHAGENGSMGKEDQLVIAPAVAKLRLEGLQVTGPVSADTAFHEEARQKYDAILCMYHDQALIPVKTLDFHGGINVTLGLPFVRTSPDHGTALDLAGTGRANPKSLIAAIRMAAQLALRSA